MVYIYIYIPYRPYVEPCVGPDRKSKRERLASDMAVACSERAILVVHLKIRDGCPEMWGPVHQSVVLGSGP